MQGKGGKRKGNAREGTLSITSSSRPQLAVEVKLGQVEKWKVTRELIRKGVNNKGCSD